MTSTSRELYLLDGVKDSFIDQTKTSGSMPDRAIFLLNNLSQSLIIFIFFSDSLTI